MCVPYVEFCSCHSPPQNWEAIQICPAIKIRHGLPVLPCSCFIMYFQLPSTNALDGYISVKWISLKYACLSLSLPMCPRWVDIWSCPQYQQRDLIQNACGGIRSTVNKNLSLVQYWNLLNPVRHYQLGYRGKEGLYCQCRHNTIGAPIKHDSIFNILILWTKSKVNIKH